MRPVLVGFGSAALSSGLALVVLGFVTLMIYTTVDPAREAIQDFAVCRDADRIDRQDTRSTQRRTTAGGYRDVGATTTDLTCHYGSQVRQVGNDAAFLRGGAYAAAGAVLGSVLIGAVVGSFAAWRVHRRMR